MLPKYVNDRRLVAAIAKFHKSLLTTFSEEEEKKMSDFRLCGFCGKAFFGPNHQRARGRHERACSKTKSKTQVPSVTLTSAAELGPVPTSGDQGEYVYGSVSQPFADGRADTNAEEELGLSPSYSSAHLLSQCR